MIVRVLGVGQYEVADDLAPDLDRLDNLLVEDFDADDEAAFRRELRLLLDLIQDQGTALPDDYLGPSDLVLPGPDASLEDVRRLLAPGALPD